ncbi:flavin reductase family protein [Sedimentitalea todarodis]|uniref:Flavin reductase family protein n=1 Tax=Sedimentitalea todarodis TaxID=1631240 RepID=A0ABU3VEK3_9RHOB|nr:flavin reductase family protein [Sedimentitalea todarodis]MDU9004613.1 flavin reductase family protein [Sedimentitalea todarodis]
MSDITIIPGPDTSRAYRMALGCFGTGVTVVTTATDEGPLAMTANSFASVSLDPAMVLWCAAKHSKRYQAFVSAQDYSIHILAEDQMDLALHFSRIGTDFSPTSWQPDSAGVPILRGCIARFDCRQTALHDAGDHTIIVGLVQRVMRRPGTGLLHKSGQYGGFSGFDQQG